MYAQVLITFHPITTILILSLIIPTHYAQSDSEKYNSCHKTTTSACGKPIGIIEYPFWGENIRPPYCGLERFKLSCENSDAVVDIGYDSKYRVVEINPSTSVLKLNYFDNPLMEICASRSIDSPTLNELYNYGQNTEDLHFYYNCDAKTDTTWIQSKFSCSGDDDNQVYFFKNNSWSADLEYKLGSCYHTSLPVNTTMVLEEFIKNVENAILQRQPFNFSFEVQYNKTYRKACLDCVKNGGLCWQGTNIVNYNTCLYSDGTVHSPYPGKSKKLGLKIGIASGVVGGSMLLLVLFVLYRRKKTKRGSSVFSQNVSSYPKDVDAFLRQYGSSIPKRFRYSAVKKITNSFKEELGKGGYGNVYRGSFADGRIVAVKLLNATKGNGEEFINEVASIGRTSHVNVVTLLGFCYEGKRRALIYEFMPNGSLEKFIRGTNSPLEGQHLGWEKLYNIAIGIARGLEYLHRGCNTRILHFDIKPHNILLDKDFCPKISDFGLAKLYTGKESVVSSLMQARGTIGYIAPEVFSRSFGPVSFKSDVYSYGMMTLEMVGGRKNVDARADHTSEIYYPRWLYKRIQVNDELNLASETSVEENELVRKMVIVGLWCIQTNPSQRPSMSKVIEMLEGNIAVLEIPPKPYLCSVSNSPSNSQRKLVFVSPSGTEITSSP